MSKQRQMFAPFQASRNGASGRSKSWLKDITNASPPTLLDADVESREVMVKLARLPAVIIVNGAPVTTVVEAHVTLAKSNVWAEASVAWPNAMSRRVRPADGCKLDNRLMSERDN